MVAEPNNPGIELDLAWIQQVILFTVSKIRQDSNLEKGIRRPKNQQ
jgi:hypothetical protein